MPNFGPLQELRVKSRGWFAADLAFFKGAPDRQYLLRAPYPGEDEYFCMAAGAPLPAVLACYAVLVWRTRRGRNALPIPINSHDDIGRLNNDASCRGIAAYISEVLSGYSLAELAAIHGYEPRVLH